MTMLRTAARKDSSLTDERDLLVTDECFDHLKSESDRPARAADPKMVNFFRSMRGTVAHH